MGLLFMLAASTAGAFGLVLAGRSSARLLSDRVAMGPALVGPLLFAGSLSIDAIVGAQRYSHVWYVAFQPVAFAVSLAALGETTRGAHSGRRSAPSYLAERADAVVASAIVVIVFLGGWSLPWMGGASDSTVSGALRALASVAVFAAKLLAVVYALGWVRRALERRYGRLGAFGWRWLVPAALANVVLTAAFLAVALEWRTPMGSGILAEVTEDGLWIGWAGYVYFLLAAAATVALVACVVATINRREWSGGSGRGAGTSSDPTPDPRPPTPDPSSCC